MCLQLYPPPIHISKAWLSRSKKVTSDPLQCQCEEAFEAAMPLLEIIVFLLQRLFHVCRSQLILVNQAFFQ